MPFPQSKQLIETDVMTTKEVAVLLRLHPVTISLAATAGELPGRKVGNRWRFSRSVIAAWLAEGEANNG